MRFVSGRAEKSQVPAVLKREWATGPANGEAGFDKAFFKSAVADAAAGNRHPVHQVATINGNDELKGFIGKQPDRFQVLHTNLQHRVIIVNMNIHSEKVQFFTGTNKGYK